MKKQVLSFNEFILESYRMFENEEEANAWLEAVGLIVNSGLSEQGKDIMGDISGICKLASTKEDPNPDQKLGDALLGFLGGISSNGVKISDISTKINVITYDNLVGGSIMTSEQDRIKLVNWITGLNTTNTASKGSGGAYQIADKTYWSKVQDQKRFSGISGMTGKLGGKLNRKDLGWFGKSANWFASFFTRKDLGFGAATKDTIYLADSGLLGNNVITDVSSGKITVLMSGFNDSGDMFLGGGPGKYAKRDRKGISNVSGNKKAKIDKKDPYNIEQPLGANLLDNQIYPTESGSSDVKKSSKAYFTIVLYSAGEPKPGDPSKSVPFTEIIKTEKTKLVTGNSQQFVIDILDENDADGKSKILFSVNNTSLSPAGKGNIDNAIEPFSSITSIQVMGYASQEGTLQTNQELCLGRAKAVAEYIASQKDWNISSSIISYPKTATDLVEPDPNKEGSMRSTIQPASPAKPESERAKWRKVRLTIVGTKSVPVEPKKVTYTEITATKSSFTPEQVDIKQMCICFEVSSSDTSLKRKEK